MSFNKNLVVACFTLALLVESHGAAALCERSGVWCSSGAVCVNICKHKGGNGRCSTEHVVGDPSCVCGGACSAQSTTAAVDEAPPLEKPARVDEAPPLEKPATVVEAPPLEKPATATPGRRGMGMLN